MSETRNIESLNNKQGEFHPSIAPQAPLEKHGHQPGVKASPADHAPEFHAKTMPPGSAPAGSTYTPNPSGETPAGGAKASDSLGGADSREVSRGLGQPIYGESSAELRHDGESHRKHHGSGLEGVGASGRDNIVDERITANQRGLEREEAAAGKHGNKGELGAEDIPPVSAEQVASGRG
ncbi:hypothetical protein AJ79_04409 [Helicocarpus griseus UAMH5409]|uniref:Uncharacterized protein n=1 Tax=Helicocarpus griseus UAMH5409 TaxID=1447875 RepID=A0A2B7XTD9_9EURO|nr:hypothetical protein AJ79_04409 [Helicocarpus griseus UAMH5409]